jgi:hypothetical protein
MPELVVSDGLGDGWLSGLIVIPADELGCESATRPLPVPAGGVKVLDTETVVLGGSDEKDVGDTNTGPASADPNVGSAENVVDEVDEDEELDMAAGRPSPDPLGKGFISLVCRRTGIKYLLFCWYCRCGVGAASPVIKRGALSSARDAAHSVVGLRILYN